MTTLYVTKPGSLVEISHRQFRVCYQQQTLEQIPIEQVTQIVLFTLTNLSRKAEVVILSRQIPVLFLSYQGVCLGRLEPQQQHQKKYWMQQVKCSQKTKFTRTVAESIIRAKLYNNHSLLLQLNHGNYTCETYQALEMLEILLKDLPAAKSVDELRGYDDTADNLYYQALFDILAVTFFPTDVIGNLLNLGYALLHQQMVVIIAQQGMESQISHLYPSTYHQLPLACDLMAEFRAPMVDKLVADLFTSVVLTLNDFTYLDERGHHLSVPPHTVQKFIQYWEQKLESKVTHPYAGKVTYRHCLELQVQQYLAFLLGEVGCYRTFLGEKPRKRKQVTTAHRCITF